MNRYILNIWAARYFWTHLALSDLRSRWRRSFFGALWSVIQPLGMTLLLSVVFSQMFKSDITLLAPYILSGMLVWDFMIASITGGSLAFVQADAYIKQCRHPLAIYTLRIVLSNLVVLAMASIALYGWAIVVTPNHFNWSWLSTILIFPMLGLIAWPLATLLAYIGAKFRDIPHVIGLIMQALWFISPVYFEEKVFRNGGLNGLIDYNPLYHLLQFYRAPLLTGQWPTIENIAYCVIFSIICTVLAIAIGRKAERNVIFYL